MALEGFIEYKRREFCKDVNCSIQLELNRYPERSEEYELIRKTCRNTCKYTTWQFHHWLIEKGYIIIASLELENKRSFFASIDKDLLNWIDEQVQSGRFQDRSSLIETLILKYQK